MTKTIFIPGAYSTEVCFNWIRSRIKIKDQYVIDYDVEDGLDYNLDHIEKAVRDITKGESVNLIGHSMGGLIAVLLYHRGIKVKNLISISAPLGGSKFAEYIKWWTKSKLISDLSNKNLYSELKTKPITCKNIFVVTTRGINHPWSQENDCVVSVESQTAIDNVYYKYFDYSHSEILQSEDIIDIINEIIFRG
jgi:pimeloyl-ACP methyl ester carboxylesterase